MQLFQRCLLLPVYLACLALSASGELISQALLCLPHETEYLEDDNLASLRKLPDYNTLRQNYSGQPLEEAKHVLTQLGISEGQVEEVVSASSPSSFYGLISGTFSAQAAFKRAAARHLGKKMLETQLYCANRATCIIFLEDSIAAFGTASELKAMLETRQGILSRLSSNREASTLLNGTDRTAPVRGILLGTELQRSVSDLLAQWSGLKTDWSRLSSNVEALGYSIHLDKKAHVAATLNCTSTSAAALLAQALNALGVLPSQNIHASSNAGVVHVKADTDLTAQ